MPGLPGIMTIMCFTTAVDITASSNAAPSDRVNKAGAVKCTAEVAESSFFGLLIGLIGEFRVGFGLAFARLVGGIRAPALRSD